MATYEQIVGSQPESIAELSGSCDLCGSAENVRIYDALIPRYGSWAYVCESCFNDFRCSLGMGLGQMYEIVESENA